MSTPPHFLVDEFASISECNDLKRIHDAYGIKGYRKNTTAVSLANLVRRSNPDPLTPYVAMRGPTAERIRNAAAERFSIDPLRLYCSFSSVVCWYPGASLGPHYDSNRPHLQHRYISAVLYLNSCCAAAEASTASTHGQEQRVVDEFSGGAFEFLDPSQCPELYQSQSNATRFAANGKRLNDDDDELDAFKASDHLVVASITPKRGQLLVFASDEHHPHRVLPVIDGLRYAFLLWFTLDSGSCEDSAHAPLLSLFERRDCYDRLHSESVGPCMNFLEIDRFILAPRFGVIAFALDERAAATETVSNGTLDTLDWFAVDRCANGGECGGCCCARTNTHESATQCQCLIPVGLYCAYSGVVLPFTFPSIGAARAALIVSYYYHGYDSLEQYYSSMEWPGASRLDAQHDDDGDDPDDDDDGCSSVDRRTEGHSEELIRRKLFVEVVLEEFLDHVWFDCTAMEDALSSWVRYGLFV